MTDELSCVSIRNMPRDLWRRVVVLACERNVRVNKIVIEALERYLEKVNK